MRKRAVGETVIGFAKGEIMNDKGGRGNSEGREA